MNVKIKKTGIILLLVPLFFACKKQTITTHENLIVDGNTPPPYEGVSTTQINVYVDKLHIDILGLQANNTDLNTFSSYLKQQQLSEAARDSVINVLLAKDEYYDRLFSSLSSRMLESLNKFEIKQEELSYDFIAQYLYSIQDTLNAQIVEVERDKFAFLHDCDSLYRVGAITLNQFYKAFCDNEAYDEINMGSFNFAVSCFENYFFRAPTVDEGENGKKMCDGESVPMLHGDGNSKEDFMNLIINSDEFYQGLVIENYTLFLARKPTSYETFVGTQIVKTGNDLKALKRSILRGDEYAGF